MKKITFKLSHDELIALSLIINSELMKSYDAKDLNTSLIRVLLWGLQKRIYNVIFIKKDSYNFFFSMEEGISFFICFHSLTPDDAFQMATLEKIKLKIHQNLV